MMFFKSRPTYDWMIAGLGNPGLQYENTRHNAGFMAADAMALAEGFEFSKHKFQSACGEFRLKDMRILVIKPQTFMNNSGKAVREAMSFYKIPMDRVIVMHDDMMLDVGKLRMRRKGSDGGQKGMRDIIELSGTDEIMRIKIGVGKKPNPEYDVVSWVLGKIPKEDSEEFRKAVNRAVKAAEEIILRGIDSAMNKFNN